MQIGILICYTARNSLSRMSPEPLLLILGLWLAITVLYHHHLIRKGDEKEPFWQYGLIAGMGMGLKFSFLPLWFLPLILLKGFRYRFFYLGITGIVFLILTANPLMNLEGFQRFMFNEIVSREGYNRPLKLESSKFGAMLDGFSLLLENIWRLEKPLILLVLIFVVNGLLVLLVKTYKETNNMASWNLRLWSGLLLTLFGQMILVANGPSARMHYLTPVFGLIGLLNVVTWKWPDRPREPGLKTPLWGKNLYLAFIVVILGWTSLNLPENLALAQRGAKQWQEAHQFKTDNHLLNEATVYYYRSSNKQFALSFGNSFARRHFSQQLASMYPNMYVFYRQIQRIYSQFGPKQETLDDIVRSAKTVLIQGQINNPPVIPSLKQTAYDRGEPGSFSKVSNFTIPTKSPHAFSAEVLFVGSKEWIILLRPQSHNTQTEGKDWKE